MAGLIPRYPGSKYGYPWLDDGSTAPVIVSPFLGADALIQKLMPYGIIDHIFAADADYSVRAIWQAWFKPEIWREVYKHCDQMKAALVKASEYSRDELKVEFDLIKDQWFELGEGSTPFKNRDNLAQKAAVSLVLRSCASAGGVIRTGKTSGRLNISPDASYFRPKKGKSCCDFASWKYRFPTMPKRAPQFNLKNDWKQALEDFSKSGLNDAICVLDPPYFGPNDASYPGHKPKDKATLGMAMDSLDYAGHLMTQGRIRRLIVCNYDHNLIDESVKAWARRIDLPLQKTIVGRLDGLNQKANTGNALIEANWIIEDPVIKQGNLFSEELIYA